MSYGGGRIIRNGGAFMGKVLHFPKGELVDALFQKALHYEEQFNRVDAIKLYRQIVTLEPKNYHAHINLGVALFYEGEYALAKNHFLEAVALHPDAVVAYYNLACAWMELGHVDVAIKELHTALQLDPSFADTHFQLALIYQRTDRFGNLEKALEHWRIYAKFRPSGPWREFADPLLKGFVINKAPIVTFADFFDAPVQLKLF